MLEKTFLCRQLLTSPRDGAEPFRPASAPMRTGRSLRRAASRAQAPACAQGPGQSPCRFGFAMSLRQPPGFQTGVHGHV